MGNVKWRMREGLAKLGEDKAGKLCAEMLPGRYREWGSKWKLLMEQNNVMVLES